MWTLRPGSRGLEWRGLLWLLLLAMLFHTGGGQDGEEQEDVQILYPTQDSTVSATAAVEMRCIFAGLRKDAAHAVVIDVDEQEGGEFPIPGDGEYTFTLPPLEQGSHRLKVLLLRGNLLRTSRSISIISSASTPSPQPPSPPPPPPPPPQMSSPQREDEPPSLAIAAPAQCQRLESAGVVSISTRANTPARLAEHTTLSLEINRHANPVSFGEHSVAVSQLPDGLHLLSLHAAWTSSTDGQPHSARSEPVWFAVGAEFNADIVQRTSDMHAASDARARAQLWRCMMSHTHQLLPQLWISLSSAGKPRTRTLNSEPQTPNPKALNPKPKPCRMLRRGGRSSAQAIRKP
jgi:hypothetical protein